MLLVIDGATQEGIGIRCEAEVFAGGSNGHKIEHMEDPVEINRRIERLLKRVRRRDDYGELLFSGEVIRSPDGIDDPDEWRAEIKKKARKQPQIANFARSVRFAAVCVVKPDMPPNR